MLRAGDCEFKDQVIQAADGGVITEMRVQEGDEVKLGQIIAVLEKDRALAAYNDSVGKVTALRMTVTRLRAEIGEKNLTFPPELTKNYPLLVETQMNLYKQKRSGYQEMVKVLVDTIKLAESELAMNEPLLKFGDVGQADILRLKKRSMKPRPTL